MVLLHYMEERNLTLEITNNNWKNWVLLILTIFPVSYEFKVSVINKIGLTMEDLEW